MAEPDINAPVDEYHKVSLTLRNEIRSSFAGLSQRVSHWEPSPMPTDYRPSASERFS